MPQVRDIVRRDPARVDTDAIENREPTATQGQAAHFSDFDVSLRFAHDPSVGHCGALRYPGQGRWACRSTAIGHARGAYRRAGTARAARFAACFSAATRLRHRRMNIELTRSAHRCGERPRLSPRR